MARERMSWQGLMAAIIHFRWRSYDILLEIMCELRDTSHAMTVLSVLPGDIGQDLRNYREQMYVEVRLFSTE